MAQDKIMYTINGKYTRKMTGSLVPELMDIVNLSGDRETLKNKLLKILRDVLPSEIINCMIDFETIYKLVDYFRTSILERKGSIVCKAVELCLKDELPCQCKDPWYYILRYGNWKIEEKPKSLYTFQDEVIALWGAYVDEDVAMFLLCNFNRDDYSFENILGPSSDLERFAKVCMELDYVLPDDLECFKRKNSVPLDLVVKEASEELRYRCRHVTRS